MSALALAPSTLPATDERLAQLVTLAIRERGPRSLHGLTIVASESVVTLRGSARSFYDKQLLLHAVQRVPGVREIIDEVHVLPSSSLREALD